jgi:2-amino-4-hydroxy-6-hydroxymethyldihydropteridine diphosphokinase
MLHKRRFTLLPLAEIAPDFKHPVFKLNIRDLLEKCEDTGKVEMFRDNNYNGISHND